MCSEFAFRSKLANGSLGSKYRLSRAQDVAKEKFFSRLDSNLSGRCLLLSQLWTLRAKLHFITAVLLSLRYSRSCLAVISHLAFPQEVARVPNSPSHNWMSAADLHTLLHLQPVSQHSHPISVWTARSITPFARRSPAGEFATTV